ncbi:MAG: hypothetical protein Kapaf2KO_00440 [Candidatus Kapaibacteriales bacterium]
MRVFLTFLLLMFLGDVYAVEYDYRYEYLDSDNKEINSYLLVLPKEKEIKGVIVRDYSRLPDMKKGSPYKIMDLAMNNGFAYLITDTSVIMPDLYYNDEGPKILDDLIEHAISNYGLVSDNIFIGGISASGTRALRFAQYCAEGKSKYGRKISGVFSVDSPLDIVRFYVSATKNKDNFTDGMAWEAEVVPGIFEQELGGSLMERKDAYHKASVFTQSADDFGNAKYYLDVPMILFHEPDIDWWLSERGAAYYDINSFDIAAFYIYQILNGNKDATIITTTGKGFDGNGNRKPHSWTIVDEDMLMDWMLERVE